MNDHIPDVTKMISDTPRTDAEAFYPHDSKYKVCDADFARILERELNAANAEIEEKRKDVVWLATEKAKLEERIKRLEEENNELRAEEARLLNTNGELERRIKRLIDAGDAMFPWSERVGQEFWTKAKEAKP